MNIAMILAGGIGARFGDKTPKQYQDLFGKPVVSYVVEAIQGAKSIDRLIVVCAKEYFDFFRSAGAETVEGGAERNISLKNGLDYIRAHYDCKKIMIFDAMRPFVTPRLIDEYMFKLDEYEVVATCQKIVDSLGCLDFHECDRSRYYILQSPEAFRFDVLYRHFDPKSPLVEAYQQLPPSTTLYKYFDFPNNYKLTFKHDLEFMRIYMAAKGKNK